MSRLRARAPTRIQTERRRLLQPLWTALDATLAPRLDARPILAVSGGPDSRALLEAVARWPRRQDGDISVAAVDHRTRPEARDEAVAVVSRAMALGFEAAVLTANAAADDEGALRAARMDALVRHARAHGRGVLVTAHHEGDVAESALLSWVSLGGGGAAMATTGSWRDVVLVRPFSALPRETLRLALTACRACDPFIDPEQRSARAQARRHHLLPLGPERPVVEGRLAAAARRGREDEDVLRAAAERMVSAERGGWFVREGPPALLRRALRRALAAEAGDMDLRSSSPAIETLLELVRRGRPGTVHLRGAEAEVILGGVLIRRTAPSAWRGDLAAPPALRALRALPGTRTASSSDETKAGSSPDPVDSAAGVAAVRSPTHDDGPVHERKTRPTPFRDGGDA